MSSPEGIEWKEYKTESGKTFAVSTLPVASEGGGSAALGVEAKVTSSSVDEKELEPFGIAVHWPAVHDGGESGQWKDTTAEVSTTSQITRYNLYKQSDDSHYKYMLEITNAESYCYYFSDQTGDRYKLNTILKSNHYVRFNSDKPSIVFVSGS